jgi:hypothetical protein
MLEIVPDDCHMAAARIDHIADMESMWLPSMLRLSQDAETYLDVKSTWDMQVRRSRTPLSLFGFRANSLNWDHWWIVLVVWRMQSRLQIAEVSTRSADDTMGKEVSNRAFDILYLLCRHECHDRHGICWVDVGPWCLNYPSFWVWGFVFPSDSVGVFILSPASGGRRCSRTTV